MTLAAITALEMEERCQRGLSSWRQSGTPRRRDDSLQIQLSFLFLRIKRFRREGFVYLHLSNFFPSPQGPKAVFFFFFFFSLYIFCFFFNTCQLLAENKTEQGASLLKEFVLMELVAVNYKNHGCAGSRLTGSRLQSKILLLTDKKALTIVTAFMFCC